MTSILIEFLVGLYFIVLDSPILFTQPISIVGLIRFILGIILVVLAVLGVSLIR